MITFRQYLLGEGVVKVPPKMYKSMVETMWWSVLSQNYDHYQSSNDPKFISFINRKNKMYNVNKQEAPYSDQTYSKTFNYNTKYLPGNYPKGKVPRITLVLNYGKGQMKSAGSYVWSTANNKQSIYMNMYIKHFEKYTDRLHDLEAFKENMNSLENTLKHELMHSVQVKMLSPTDPNQIAHADNEMYPGANETELYYLSQIEFDPQIISSVKAFDEMKKFHTEFEPNITDKAIFGKLTDPSKQTRGDIGLESKNFFKALKKYDETRWKVAIKKLSNILRIK